MKSSAWPVGMLSLTLLAYRQPHIPLMGAAQLGSNKHVAYALECNQAKPTQYDAHGNTPLHYAAYIGSKEVTNTLLAHNANPNAENTKGKTPLHIAVQRDHDYITRRLMVYGAQPNAQDAQGNTPLHIITRNNNRIYAPQIVCDLLRYGADPYKKNKAGITPLQLAKNVCIRQTQLHAHYRQCKNAHEILQALKTGPACTRPETPLDRYCVKVAKSTHVDIMKHLTNCPAVNVNKRYGKHEKTMLMYAARNNRTQIVSYLINKGANKSLKDRYGKTAYDYAQKHNNKQLNNLLKV